ncbi:hypothetical protein HMSSN139_08890 [Paenibacillus sp. HMSSN-139]|nr:hypothetical protein HMSSN139_08890 [Paenibacillus sp. HMSSN-139]
MRNETVHSDITVVGGGLAGVCAAVAAARLGRKVALVQNRPVLGGNSSSEVRVWVCGATAHGTNRYARETGIMGEMFVENQYRNPDGNPYLWDMVVLETVLAEPNLSLYLNTDVHEVEADGEEEARQIRSVTGWMMGSERRIRFESPIFLDCTGDGLVGFLAGAKYRLGREARHEFGEAWAPEVADDITLGSTLLFYTKDAGHPVKFVPPSFAKDITQTPIPLKRVIRSGDSGCHYWWIEWGGELDTVHDNERIRDELSAVIYGIWDYIKNSGQFDADHMTLEWVGSIPGKREYRRFLGDYTLTQNDILAQERSRTGSRLAAGRSTCIRRKGCTPRRAAQSICTRTGTTISRSARSTPRTCPICCLRAATSARRMSRSARRGSWRPAPRSAKPPGPPPPCARSWASRRGSCRAGTPRCCGKRCCGRMPPCWASPTRTPRTWPGARS